MYGNGMGMGYKTFWRNPELVFFPDFYNSNLATKV